MIYLNAVFLKILEMSFWGSLLFIALSVFTRFSYKKIPLNLQYFIFVPVVIRLIFPFDLKIPIPIPQKNQSAIIVQNQSVEFSADSSINSSGDSSDEFLNIFKFENDKKISDTSNNISNTTENNEITIKKDKLNPISYLAIIWLLVFLTKILLMFMSSFVLTVRIKKSETENTYLQNFYEKYFDDYHGKNKEKFLGKYFKKPKFIVSNYAKSPFVKGIFASSLVIPDKNFTESELNYIFLHEITHLKRFDLPIKNLSAIICALHWFNPFAYMLLEKINWLCELSCDELVLKNEINKNSYGEFILSSAHGGRFLNQALSVSGGKKNLRKRIENIKFTRKTNIPLCLFAVALTISLTACTIIKEETAENPIIHTENFKIPEVLKEEIPETTRLLLECKDNFGLSDTILAISYHYSSNTLDILSYPRELSVNPDSVNLSLLKEETSFENTEYQLYFFSHYQKPPVGNLDNLQELAITDYFEKEYDFKADYYISLDIAAFRNIVDIFGGVEINIPHDMIYNDPFQDLEIKLYKGNQILDGEKAEMFVRFRYGYENKNLDRLENQNYFIRQFFETVSENKNPLHSPHILSTILFPENYNVVTNIKPSDINKYLPYILDFDFEKINVSTAEL